MLKKGKETKGKLSQLQEQMPCMMANMLQVLHSFFG